MTRGRPLRFLALLLSGWTAVRVAMLWPDAEPSRPLAAAAARGDVAGAKRPSMAPGVLVAALPHGRMRQVGESRASGAMAFVTEGEAPLGKQVPLNARFRRNGQATGAEPLPEAPTPADGSEVAAAGSRPSAGGTASPTAAIDRPVAARTPLHGSSWLIARPTGGDSLAFGQLGASQAGMRLTYALSDRRRVALSLRASTPLRGVGRESAAGLDWQPSRLPLHVLTEQRFPLDGGEPRPAVQLIGGGVLRLPLRLVVEGYAQAGGVYRRGGFADGSARVSRVLLARTIFTLDLGAGAWGAAQRQVSRFDIGPSLGLTLPARGGTVRLAVDYRLRVAGRARPGSGPAMSLGSSF